VALVLCNGGKVALLNAKKNFLITLKIGLYQNNHSPSATDTIADYTPCSFDGYASQLVNSWGNAFLNAQGKAETDEQVHTWTATGGSVANQVFGYYIFDGGNNLIYAELNPSGPFLIDAAGKSFSVQPRLTETTDPNP